MPATYLITAATGRQGGAAARLLLKNGNTVHALVRNKASAESHTLQKLGVALFEGDYNNKEAIKEAIQGVQGIFLNLFPTFDLHTQGQQAQYFVEMAKAAGVESVVLSTVFYVNRPDLWEPRDGMRAYYEAQAIVEDVIRTSGLTYAIMRPPALMHNFLKPDSQWHYPELATEGKLAHAFEPTARTPYLDGADVGRFAVAALLDPRSFSGHEIDLCAQNLTIDEIGGSLRKASGRNIPIVRRTAEELEAKKDMLPTLSFQVMANEVDITIDAEALTERYGIRMTTLDEFLERERENLLRSLPAVDGDDQKEPK
ncbi:hypothetical protein SEUCBS140593_006051 [Sporothrix eucalyptigena]|uniref:NmrA-like domain-containing protein n=1 Tax=Sporothrix eucalyptigena TaxID=1812306 RepID=A0ABP0C1N0_9PEZI